MTNKKAIRYAPSFVEGVGGGDSQPHAYTAQTLAGFIGMLEPKREKASERLRIALDALELIEQNGAAPL